MHNDGKPSVFLARMRFSSTEGGFKIFLNSKEQKSVTFKKGHVLNGVTLTYQLSRSTEGTVLTGGIERSSSRLTKMFRRASAAELAPKTTDLGDITFEVCAKVADKITLANFYKGWKKKADDEKLKLYLKTLD